MLTPAHRHGAADAIDDKADTATIASQRAPNAWGPRRSGERILVGIGLVLDMATTAANPAESAYPAR